MLEVTNELGANEGNCQCLPTINITGHFFNTAINGLYFNMGMYSLLLLKLFLILKSNSLLLLILSIPFLKNANLLTNVSQYSLQSLKQWFPNGGHVAECN